MFCLDAFGEYQLQKINKTKIDLKSLESNFPFIYLSPGIREKYLITTYRCWSHHNVLQLHLSEPFWFCFILTLVISLLNVALKTAGKDSALK